MSDTQIITPHDSSCFEPRYWLAPCIEIQGCAYGRAPRDIILPRTRSLAALGRRAVRGGDIVKFPMWLAAEHHKEGGK